MDNDWNTPVAIGQSTGSEAAPIALVTGGAARIGRAIATGLAADGWSVVIHANRSLAAARDLAACLTTDRAPAFAVEADLCDPEAPERLVGAAVAMAGGVPDLVVNNASVFDYDDAASQTPDNWRRQMTVNATAPMMISRAYYRRTAAGKGVASGGAIVNILDTKVFNLDGRFLSYEVSKATLLAITLSTARAYAPHVRVNAVAPGLTLPSGRQSEADFVAAHTLNPLGMGAAPDQIARAVVMFATTPGLTGQILAVDGGEALAGADPSVFEAM